MLKDSMTDLIEAARCFLKPSFLQIPKFYSPLSGLKMNLASASSTFSFAAFARQNMANG